MKNYEPPRILATYSVEELVKEAAVCQHYSGQSSGPKVSPPKKGPKK